jgi:hypothetical protein
MVVELPTISPPGSEQIEGCHRTEKAALGGRLQGRRTTHSHTLIHIKPPAGAFPRSVMA